MSQPLRIRSSVRPLVVVTAIVLGMFGPARAEAVTPNEKFVTRLYLDFTGRSPTSNELQWGAALLQSWGRSQYVHGLFTDSTVQSTWIRGVYQRYLVTDPTPTQSSAALSALQSSGDFLDVELDVISSTAYFSQAESTNANFVEALYGDILWREPDDAGRTYWTNQLNAGSKTRRQVASAFVRGNEAAAVRVKGTSDQETCRSTTIQFSDDLSSGSYCLILDRMADSNGATYWTSRLASTDQLPTLWADLASSSEYFNLAQTT